MKRLAALLTTTFFLSAAISAQTIPATTVFINGNIYTANDKQPHAEAVAVRDDRIIFVGSNADIEKLKNNKTHVIDLHGATMLPGLTDAHAHFVEIGQRVMEFNLENTKSLDDLLDKLKARVAKAKPGEWITGKGWIETFWQPATFPTRWDLDRVSPNNPVLLTRADLHASVANSAALKIAGITRTTKNPYGGEILRDKKTGEPNGMLLDNAETFVTDHMPEATTAEIAQAMQLADKKTIAFGWTQLQEPSGSYREVDVYKKLYASGKLKIRIYKAVMGPGEDANKLLHDGPIIEAYHHHFTLRSIKVLADGALGSRGAALLQPYSDAPNTSGFMIVPKKEYLPMLIAALRKGIQIETHAIGDAANRYVLNEYEKALQTVPPAQRKIADPRWRIEHAQIINPVDIPRFVKSGIIPSMQPSHAIGDLHFAANRLGFNRLAGAYAWRSLINTGVIVPGGSDAPVERGDPMVEFYAAVARKDLNGFSGAGWHPEQAVTREQALKMFTVWPAYAAFEEHLRGSIEPGKLADFTVVSADIMKIPEQEIPKTHCLMTVIGGEIEFNSKNR